MIRKSLVHLGTLAYLLASLHAFAGGDVIHTSDPLEKTFITNPGALPDVKLQQSLMQQSFWQNFIEEYGSWYVVFDEKNRMPHKAYGKPISVPGYDAQSTAINFLNNQLGPLQVPVNNLNFRSVSANKKYYYVNYIQYYQGLEVLFSNVQVKMTHDYLVNQFTLDCHPGISLATTPGITELIALQKACNGVSGLTGVSVNPVLKILPVPAAGQYQFHLVYEVMVENLDEHAIPGNYYTLVDANSGEILYRTNQVRHAANTDININGTLYLSHPFNPATVEPMKYMRVTENGNIWYTDDTGYLGLTNTTGVVGTLSLQGRWVRIKTAGVTPTWTVNLMPGQNNFNIDTNGTDIKQRSTYYSINTVHDYMKTKFPSFTGLDFALTANIDVAGTCNAFYNGSAVNFYAEGGGCNATSLVADVCYHEYGHGINDKFYQSIGFSFSNGAMHEGYADLWALGITTQPVLGIGFYQSNPVGYIRRYDVNKKIYPQNLVGEVHADGEIIAGSFWDVGINLGNLQQMMDLFKETFYAGIAGPNGTEGVLFNDILIETLSQDDDDGDLTNGTPNYCPILAGFETHGITLNPQPVACTPIVNFTWSPSVICEGSNIIYHDNSNFAGTWNWNFPGGTPSTSTDKNPVVTYNTQGVYDVTLYVTNTAGTDSLIQTGVITVLPGFGQYGLPYYESFESVTFPGTDWTIENAGGNGWELNSLAAKSGVNSVYVDNYAGNLSGSTDIFYTPSYNLTGSNNNTMTFQLAFAVKESTATDRLNVYASTNCGQLWSIRYTKNGMNLATAGTVTTPFVPVQNDWAMQSVSISSSTFSNKPNVRFKFEYTHDRGNNIFIDDININGTVGIGEPGENTNGFGVYPNPVNASAYIVFSIRNPQYVYIDVLDITGRTVNRMSSSYLNPGEYRFELPENLSNGIYTVKLFAEEFTASKKVVVNR